jgi:hypothetical protein
VGEKEKRPFRLYFNRSLRVEFLHQRAVGLGASAAGAVSGGAEQ